MTTTKAASSTSSPLYATATSSKRLSGLISGLDTDTLVKQLTMGTQNKIDKQMQLKQMSQWKRDSYREATKALSEFKDKYFSSSTSSSSILNASFFNSTSIKNNSSFLNVSGDASVAKNMTVTSISQLARQAQMTSNYKVSDCKLTSGTINEIWKPSAVSGKSMVINYGGEDYTVTLDSELNFSTGDNVSKITDALNKAISNTKGLAGKVEFSYDLDNNHVTLSNKGSSTMTIKDGADNLISGLGLAKGVSGDTIILGGNAHTDDFFRNTLTAGSTLDIKIGNDTYTLKIPSDVSIPYIAADADKAIDTILTEALRTNPDLGSKLNVSVSGGAVNFTKKDGVDGDLSITGGSQNLLQGLGLTKLAENSYSTTGTVNREKMVSSYLQDTLAGSTLTFSYNGVNKYITFDESKKSDYSDPASLKTYLQGKLDSAIGADPDTHASKVTVTNTDGVFRFETADPTSIISIESCDKSGVLGKNGALHVYAGETNRINTNKTLGDINGDLAAELKPSADGTYGIKVNDKTFTFKSTDTIDTIIKTINNDSQANVTISYSTINNTFSAVAKNGGSGSHVDIQNIDDTCNLATVLFGNDTNRTITTGQDAKMTVSYTGGTPIDITRTENKFTLDGVDFELLGKTDSTVSKDTPIKFSVDGQTDKLYDKIKSFIDDYNNIIDLVNKKVSERKSKDEISYVPLTDAQRADMTETEIKNWEAIAKKGILQGDSILNSLSLDLRHSMTDQVKSMKSALYEIGIATKENDYASNGKLTINEDKLKDMLNNDPDKLASLFTSDDGIAKRMQDVINKNIKTFGGDGLLIEKAGLDNSTKVDNSFLTQSITHCDSKIKDLKTLLQTQQEQCYAKFTKLEQYLSTMNMQAGLFFPTFSS